jgi:hypothetical protein
LCFAVSLSIQLKSKSASIGAAFEPFAAFEPLAADSG